MRGINVNSAFASGISPQTIPQNSSQNLHNQTQNPINPNLIAQNQEPKWVIQGRQNITEFVENIKENGVIQNYLGENVLDPGQFVRLIINFDPNSLDAKAEINTAIKDIVSKMNESERRLVIIAYKNGTVDGLIITKFGNRDPKTGFVKIEVEKLNQRFPGLNQINNFRGNPF